MSHRPVDRQGSRMTTTSTLGGQKETEEGKLSRAGRRMKRSVASFFGLEDDEDNVHKQRWQNRRMRYYKNKLKDDVLQKGDSAMKDEPDLANIRYIHDPYRMPGRHSEISSRRTTPLSSTSTYARGPRTAKRLRKDSVVKMTWKGLMSVTGARRKLRNKPSQQRSFAPGSYATDYPDDLSASMIYHHEDAISLVDDVFYDEPITPQDSRMDRIPEKSEYELPRGGWRRSPPKPKPSTPYDEIDAPDFAMRRIAGPVYNSVVEADKRQVGMGFVGRLFNRSFRSERMNSYVKTQIDSIDDHRPYFTYWVTFVQILIFIVSVAVYGIAPIGVDETITTELVQKPNLAFESVRYVEKDNLWIGPSQADLIHLGAKYSPCMRRDDNIWNAILLDRAEERESACCIRDDGSGCVQSVRSKCSDCPIHNTHWRKNLFIIGIIVCLVFIYHKTVMSTFHKFNSTSPSDGFTAGSVCGQDPRYCKNPASVAPFEWNKEDITQWPYCEETSKPGNVSRTDRHMSCDITGRPCCHGIQGECMITTREHCEFIHGYYHENYYLCSQVDCLGKICGMIPFSVVDVPDQFYRLWTSLFLHGGLFHLVITIGFQFLVMRDIEKLTGCIRIAIIYLGSGVAGNLASSIFLPYHVEVGPAGCQFGILACLLVEVLQSFQMLKRPCIALLKIAGFIFFLFLFGLLPWIDNWAHVCGFLFGFLLAFALLPYVSFGDFDKRRKLIGIILSLGGAVGLFVILIILFYVLPLYDCPGCQYFNCVPLTEDFCKNMEVSIDRQSTYSSYL